MAHAVVGRDSSSVVGGCVFCKDRPAIASEAGDGGVEVNLFLSGGVERRGTNYL